MNRGIYIYIYIYIYILRLLEALYLFLQNEKIMLLQRKLYSDVERGMKECEKGNLSDSTKWNFTKT